MTALVFSGSGASLYTEFGAAQALYDHGHKPSELVGTSGGAIVAAYLSTGVEPIEAIKYAKENKPITFIRPNWAFFKGSKGLLSLHKMDKILSKHVPETFKDVEIPLTVVASDLSKGAQVLFSSKDTPKVNVALATRASASIPAFFAPVKIGHNLVDGGVVNNLAVDVSECKVVGIRVLSDASKSIKKKKWLMPFIASWVHYLASIFGCMMTMLDRMHIDDALFANVITVHSPWNSMDFFGITDAVIDEQFRVGYEAVEKRLATGWKPEIQTIID